MTFSEIVRFIHAANHALGRAGVDNRIAPLLELAEPDWIAFRKEISDRIRSTELVKGDVDLERFHEIRLWGAVVRPKP